jgi:hypothetical protein
MAPTRELAKQVAADFELTALTLKTITIYGGAPYRCVALLCTSGLYSSIYMHHHQVAVTFGVSVYAVLSIVAVVYSITHCTSTQISLAKSSIFTCVQLVS